MKDLEDMTRAQLLGHIMHLQEKCDRLEKENIRLGWIENPDRSGGQFSEWELNRRGDEFS